MVDVPLERASRSFGEADTLSNATQQVRMDEVLRGLEGVPCDLWRVELPSGEIRAMTLDQLDEAFQAGLIAEDTRVLQAGASEWVTLGKIAGLDEPPPNSLLPVATEISHVDVDVDPAALRPRRRGVYVALAASIAVLAAVAVIATRGEGAPPAAAAGVPVVTEALPPPAPATVPGAGLGDPGKPGQLTETQKRALLDADKAREAREQQRRVKAAPPPRRRAKPGGTPFHEGGNKHDPLNSAL